MPVVRSPIVTAPRVMVPIPSSRVVLAEERLAFRFPDGYRDFVGRYGEVFHSNDVRVYGPEQVIAQNEEWRLGETVRSFFWTEEGSALDQQRTKECVRFADTIFGDVLAVHPSLPGASFLFPRHEERSYRFEGNFDESIEWLLSAGIVLAPSVARYVEPLIDPPAWEVRWLDELSHEDAIVRIRALDARSSTLEGVINGEERAEIFLPRYEARVRSVAPERTGPSRLSFVSFLEAGHEREAFRLVLEMAGVRFGEASGSG